VLTGLGERLSDGDVDLLLKNIEVRDGSVNYESERCFGDGGGSLSNLCCRSLTRSLTLSS
jgi:hypothetical protein